MRRLTGRLKYIVAAVLLTVVNSTVLRAQENLDDLYDLLAQPGIENWELVEERIILEWSRSGSATMDLLLQRGTSAIEDDNLIAALEHFSALTDFAPDFAEGWNARAGVLYQLGYYGPALADIQTALTLNPRHFGAMTGLAVIFEEIGDGAAAYDIYQRVLAINPNRPDISGAIDRLSPQFGDVTL